MLFVALYIQLFSFLRSHSDLFQGLSSGVSRFDHTTLHNNVRIYCYNELSYLIWLGFFHQRLAEMANAADAEKQHSEEWLKSHSISYLKLSLKDLVDKGKIGK